MPRTNEPARVVQMTALGALLLGAIEGCGGDTSCQTGAKYGTQCYSLSDIRNSPGHGSQSPTEQLPPLGQPIGPMPFGSGPKSGALPPAPSPNAPFMTFKVRDAGSD